MATRSIEEYLASEECGIVDSDTGVLSNWRGIWSAGTYRKGDMAVENNYIGIANKTTTDNIDPGTSLDWDIVYIPVVVVANVGYSGIVVIGQGNNQTTMVISDGLVKSVVQ